MTNLPDIVEQIDLLAPIPAIASQIMIKAEDPDSSLSVRLERSPFSASEHTGCGRTVVTFLAETQPASKIPMKSPADITLKMFLAPDMYTSPG